MRRLDHRHVVAAVADGGGDESRVVADEPHHLRLLRGRAPAADHRRRRTRHLHEELVLVRHAALEARAVEQQARRVEHALGVALQLLAHLRRAAHAHGVEGLAARHERGVARDRHRGLQLVAGQHPG